jgi:predicted nucleic acid-binding protein
MTATERFALDTNVLVYVFDGTEPDRRLRAIDVVRRASRSGRCVLPLQCVGEFLSALRRRRLVEAGERVQLARDMAALFPLFGIGPADAEQALASVALGRLSYWDGLLVATVDRAGCGTLLTEDMQDGAVHGGVTIRNPFAGERLPAEIEALLG